MTERVYYFEKKIFRGVVLILVLLFLLLAIDNKFDFRDKIYVKCEIPNIIRCENPLYGNCENLERMKGNHPSVEFAKTLCKDEFLLGSVIVGEPPSWYSKNYIWIAWLVVFLGFVVNHFLFNRPSQIKLRRLWLK